ncbi:MAG: M20/M25/M40 family metallo-hydrolase [Pyrinomonadaceae bacterium]|nr:M20/M25/M40 family metallo-hydrolase [Pyrinomonadaceae bacterium]
MLKGKIFAFILLNSLLLPSFAFGQVTQSSEDIKKIIEEGTKRSKAMETLNYLTDVIGPRLTNSPAQRRANEWTKSKLTEWGLQNAKVESWGNFGRGWTLKKYEASLVEPEQIPFHSYPKAWSPSTMTMVEQTSTAKNGKKTTTPQMVETQGAVTGDVVFMEVKTEADLEKYKGKLKGAIVFVSGIREVKPGFDSIASRHNEKSLLDLANASEQAQGQGGFRATPEMIAMQQLNTKKIQMCYEEGAAILVEASQLDAGTIRVMGASLPPNPNQGGGNPMAQNANPMRVWSKDAPKIIPQIVAAVEHYNRVARLVKQGVKVQMTININSQFNDNDLDGYNTIAEIPGTDLKDEIVMVGGHLDSWHAGTGATDNGAGVTVSMEAVRLILAAGLKPRRTIRVGLWTGEEQGLYGSRGYVAKHIGENTATGLVKKAEYDKFSAYYNLDNGTGQIRGINMQGNEQLRSIFRPWLQSFRDWNATTVSVQSVGGTDHLAFDAVGIPGFQFIQDPIEYFGRTWHTTQDVSDRMIEEDLKRSSVIMATFAYQTAMMDSKLPRKTQTALPRAGLSFNSLREEVAFNQSGLNFSICGHDLEAHEVPTEFPLFLTAGYNNLTYAE